MADKRIKWTDYERDQIYTATVDLLKQQKVPLPVDRPTKFVNALKSAQIVLPENRRRNIHNLQSGISSELKQRFADTGILSPGLGARTAQHQKEKKPDPKDQQIEALQNNLNEARAQVAANDETLRQVRAELRGYQNKPPPPTEGDVVKNFIADILYLWDAKKKALPGASHLPTELPAARNLNQSAQPVAEPERRGEKHNPLPVSEERRRAHIAIVGGKPDMFEFIRKEVDNKHADLRHFDTREGGVAQLGDRLKAFRDVSYGKVILWTTFSSHDANYQLKAHNIPYEPYTGERGGLISRVRQVIRETQA